MQERFGILLMFTRLSFLGRLFSYHGEKILHSQAHGPIPTPRPLSGFIPRTFIIVLILCCMNLGCQKETTSVNIGDKAPEFSLRNLEDEDCSLSQYLEKNEIVFMVFWADWCSFCKTGMKMMDRVYKKEKRFGFEILAINVKQSKERTEKTIRRLRVSYPVLRDPAADVAIHKYGVIAIPSFFVIDKSGIIREKILGDLSDQQIIEIVSPYLHGTSEKKENPVEEQHQNNMK